MKKILRSIFLFSLVSILMFSSNTVLIYSSAAIEAEFPTDGTVERLSQDNAFVYSSTSYNIVRHNLDTSSTDYLYFTNSAATMRSSTLQEDEVLFSEGYFPESSNNSSTRDIIGTDDRIRVSDTTVAPFSAVCRIICQFNNVKYNPTNEIVTIYSYGTAFLTSHNSIMTAGHALYGDITVKDYDDGIYNPRFPDRIVVQPGASINSNGQVVKPYGEIEVKTCYIQKEYYNSIDIDFDWGIGILDENIGDETGWFGLSVDPNVDKIPSYDVNVPGYPVDKNGDMYNAEGSVVGFNATRIYHDADAINCNSGSPLFFSDGTNYLAQGIHTTSEGTRNGATRLTMFIFDLKISLTHRNYPCEILDAYYEGDDYNQYNCVLNVVYIPPENKQLLLSKDKITFDKTVTGVTQEFYSSTTSSNKVDFDYKYYKTYDTTTGLYSGVKGLHGYTDYGLRTKYQIVAKNNNGDVISTSYDQPYNLWLHGGNSSKTIKGTIVYNNQAKNIEVDIPWVGYKTSAQVTIDGITFQLRAGPKKVSIKASETLICSQNLFFAFAVE